MIKVATIVVKGSVIRNGVMYMCVYSAPIYEAVYPARIVTITRSVIVLFVRLLAGGVFNLAVS